MKPTHRLKMLQKASNNSETVGVGWANPDGSISVVLDMGVTLTWRDRADCILTLFPIDEKPKRASAHVPEPP